jgi:hypothetical protein
MNKKQLIKLLEGRRVKTGDGKWHPVEDGKFTTVDGEMCRLKDYTRYHLDAFLCDSRVGPPCNHAPFSGDLEYQHNAHFRDYYRCRVCGTQVSRPECRFGGYVGY